MATGSETTSKYIALDINNQRLKFKHIFSQYVIKMAATKPEVVIYEAVKQSWMKCLRCHNK